MSTEQAAAVAAAWEARHRQQFVEANGFDYRDREQVNAKKREWFVKNTNFARLHPDVIALEIKPASRQPCEHPCVGIWSILDHPIIPPEDCPHDACLCDYKAIFRDELKGRFIAGWAEYNHKEKQYGP